MTAIDLSTMPNPDLVREFVEIALQMSYAELRDQHERYGDLYKLQSMVANELKARGARDLLLPLLNDKRRPIRLFAALETLAVSPAKARETLEALRALKLYPETAMAASALQRLDEGFFVPD
jgi:hypothetical protein